jgi:AraC family transcriptional regulator
MRLREDRAMKVSQRQNYAERIDRVVQHLAGRLVGEEIPDLEELAGVAALSKYHFHRVFRLMTGETVAQMVRRLRLARGGAALGDANTPVTRAAGEAGYASSQAFGRAMRAATGLSASELARSDAPQAPFAAPRGSPLSIEIVAIEPLEILAIRNVGDYAALNLAYQRLVDILGDRALVESIYGIPYSDPRFDPPASCVAECGFKVRALPAELGEARSITLPGGTFMRLRHTGSFDGIPAAFDDLMLALLDDRRFDLADMPPFVHYLDAPDERPEEELRSDLHIAVTPHPADS